MSQRILGIINTGKVSDSQAEANVRWMFANAPVDCREIAKLINHTLPLDLDFESLKLHSLKTHAAIPLGSVHYNTDC